MISVLNILQHYFILSIKIKLFFGQFQVSFFVMSHSEAGELNLCELNTSGEIEIENIPVNEIEIKQKDLLPIFDHFHRIQSTWGDR